MWTLSELKSSAEEIETSVWRVVEGQYSSSTLKITDTLEEQMLLEELLEENKPSFPEGAAGFDFVIATPFRYRPYPSGSRFRQANQAEGAYYASLTPETAIAELAFYRALFYSHAEGLEYPTTGTEHTAIQVPIKTAIALDLTKGKFAEIPGLSLKDDYSLSQALANDATKAGIEVIISDSVRCPSNGINITVLDMDAFAAKEPGKRQTWRLHTSGDRVIALREFPRKMLEFVAAEFDGPRLEK